MDHSFIETEIRRWAETHSLRVGYGFGGREVWGAYISSNAGECFQIWIEPVPDGLIGIHANFVDGPEDRVPEPAQAWKTDADQLRSTLELAYGQVVDWMRPSTRYFS